MSEGLKPHIRGQFPFPKEMSNKALAVQLERNLDGDGWTDQDVAMLREAILRLRDREEYAKGART